ncbi:hypothetical protein QTH90_08875 [Variovorax sp. J2P1-59]|uniref:hypothetical protein n=1 Tax=Variovorax flavidus TaxID=3053501 RepID=UPI002576BAF7|nr:hypothetical protein [Variovorax sp. J2P1-59]MDM0074493.1 hypothetical protein [Variovorax sp. J2P1-59]
MSRVRVFLLWLMMLAVPFQGYAAASMALCGTPEPVMEVAMAASHAGPSAHAGSHEHAVHHHDAASHADEGSSAKTSHAHSDTSHKCSTCVSCHAVALTTDAQVAPAHVLPQADLAEPASAKARFASRVPDKPPRA